MTEDLRSAADGIGGAWAAPPPGPPDSTIPLPTTTAPEQLRLTWGADPATEVTVSWSAPGSVPQPEPTLAYSTAPITHDRPGRTIRLPKPEPLDVTRPRRQAESISFTDGLNGQTTYHYHVQLTGLDPNTRYYYQVSDGARGAGAGADGAAAAGAGSAPEGAGGGVKPTAAAGSFVTAPAGRARFRFSSFGDLSTPSWDRSASGNLWTQSSDNAYYAVSAIEDPGDGQGPPLFHLMNGDLCYANLDLDNAPAVWRDFGVNVARSAANRPWMPALGNHEVEFGTGTLDGRPGDAPGGKGAQAAAGNCFNGPYGFGHYLSRFLLPDNGVTNHDGNTLRGNFYAFQVGTVLFISLDADDVIYQDSASCYLSRDPDAPPITTSGGARIPNGTAANVREYTGDLRLDPAAGALVPDNTRSRPNLQTLWLEEQLTRARADPSIDMIVAFMHQCALSSARANGSDLGIRQAWLPLFDKYEVDLVLCGHEHNYERSYPVRGYDTGAHGRVVAPNPGQTAGAPVDTRRPHVVTTTPLTVGGTPAFDTSEGTVFLVLGSGGTNVPSNAYGTGPDGLPQAKVHTQRNTITGSQATGFRRTGADSVEPAPWSARTNSGDPYGYAIFDVDPGDGPGQTTITFQYFATPRVTGGTAGLYDGTTTLSAVPFETLVFGRGLSLSGLEQAGRQCGGKPLAAGVTTSTG